QHDYKTTSGSEFNPRKDSKKKIIAEIVRSCSTSCSTATDNLLSFAFNDTGRAKNVSCSEDDPCYVIIQSLHRFLQNRKKKKSCGFRPGERRGQVTDSARSIHLQK
ncbi:hypothetical protein CEXT_195351, partial [Caerostris extrusa]